MDRQTKTEPSEGPFTSWRRARNPVLLSVRMAKHRRGSSYVERGDERIHGDVNDLVASIKHGRLDTVPFAAHDEDGATGEDEVVQWQRVPRQFSGDDPCIGVMSKLTE